MAGWYIAEPNQALIISGTRGKGPEGTAESIDYKIKTGGRAFVWPIIQKVRRLSLDLNTAEASVTCVTHQGIPVVIFGVIAFKIGDDYPSIANAARRFLGKEGSMAKRVHDLFAGHIRGIVGSLTVEDLIRDREKLQSQAQQFTALDMEKMGLIIDSLQIAEIDDPSKYIENLAKPQLAEVQRNSRIAQADNDRMAAEKEQQNNALVAAARRESEIKQAEMQAEIDKATAEAEQAGPLAAAQAQKAVVEQETEVARLNALQTEQRLESEVRRPADARAYEVQKTAEGQRQATILKAEADAEQTKLNAQAQAEATKATGEAQAGAERARGLAEAEVTKAKGTAEGEALRARAEGLATESEAVINQQLAERMPEMVAAAAKVFDNVDNMTVLNGAPGLMEAMVTVIGQTTQAMKAARSLTTEPKQPSGNGVAVS